MITSRRLRMWTCVFCAILALGMLLLGIVEYGRLPWNRYCISRLSRAQTFKDAEKYLRAVEANVDRWPAASDGIVDKLGGASQKLTFWFFALIDAGKVESSALVGRFASALEQRRELLAAWSNFVRWRHGVALRKLDVLRSMLRTGVHFGYSLQFTGDPVIASLRVYALLWFLGVSPLPSVRDARNGLTEDLLDRQLVYDEDVGRCRAVSAEGPESGFTLSFTLSRLPLPALPIRGWKGDVPDLPDPESPHLSLNPPGWDPEPEYDPGLYDGIWPLPGEESDGALDVEEGYKIHRQ